MDRPVSRQARGQSAGVPIDRASPALSRTPPRINVRGNSGSGKTTLAASLAAQLRVPHIELDALHHGPNWAQPTAQEFRARVQAAMNSAPDGWVIDGNYDSKLGTLVTDAADTVAWLDVMLPLILWRLWRRTSYRIGHNIELWNGNHESWRNAVWGRESLFVWAVRSYFRHRRQWPARFAKHPGYVHLHGDAEARAWLARTVAERTNCRDCPGS
jgi:adenylate kinase family enzyme